MSTPPLPLHRPFGVLDGDPTMDPRSRNAADMRLVQSGYGANFEAHMTPSHGQQLREVVDHLMAKVLANSRGATTVIVGEDLARRLQLPRSVTLSALEFDRFPIGMANSLVVVADNFRHTRAGAMRLRRWGIRVIELAPPARAPGLPDFWGQEGLRLRLHRDTVEWVEATERSSSGC